MSPLDPKVIAASDAIKQSLILNAGPGSAINTHPNHFFLFVQGEVDTYKAAERVVQRLEAMFGGEVQKLKAEVERLKEELAAAVAVSVEGESK